MEVYRNAGRWWAFEGDEMANKAWSIADKLRSDQKYRSRRAAICLTAYEGAAYETFNWANYSSNDDLPAYELNLTRAACDTIHAEIAGRQKPTAKFQTVNGDWKEKRRAKKLERFVNNVFKVKHGDFLTGWEMGEAVFHDATIFPDGGVIKVYCDDSGHICLERHFAHELFVDPGEAKYGSPQNLFHVYTMDLDMALWCFAEDPELDLSSQEKQKRVMAIRGSAGKIDATESMSGDPSERMDLVEIVEAWRLPFSEDEPGKHVFTCQAGIVLYEEEWTRDRFPFASVQWERDRMGTYGKSLAWQGKAMHDEIVEYSKKMAERFALCGAKRTFYTAGSIDVEQLESNEAETFIEVDKGADLPRETVPQPIAEAEAMWLETIQHRYFQLLGVSEAKAGARKEAGVTAGVALRTVNDMQSVRFLPKAKRYENLYVDMAQLIIQCAREAEAAGIDVKTGKEEIAWSEVSLPEEAYQIEVAASSALPNDPAGRLQMTQELYSAGVIGVDTYKQMLGFPDIEKQMNFITAQRDYLERIFDTFLDVEPGEIDATTYEAPDPMLINKQDAILQASQAYFEALYNDAPQENLDLIRQWIEDLTTLMAEAQADLAQVAPAAPAARMGMGGPEAPADPMAAQMPAPGPQMPPQ